MKVGNEIDHLGIAEISADYGKDAMRRKAVTVVLFLGQLALVSALFFVILLWVVALG